MSNREFRPTGNTITPQSNQERKIETQSHLIHIIKFYLGLPSHVPKPPICVAGKQRKKKSHTKKVSSITLIVIIHQRDQSMLAPHTELKVRQKSLVEVIKARLCINA